MGPLLNQGTVHVQLQSPICFGYFKTWTVDHGLDRGLDYGLHRDDHYRLFQGTRVGYFKTWTVDPGLDRGLDYGLDS